MPERGAATVEHTALTLLVALAALATLAALSGGTGDAGRELAGMLARRIACPPRLEPVCRRHATVRAYGWPLARLARALAPAPVARAGPGGLPLVPVDFRYCRRPSCAIPRDGPDALRLTASNRRTTVFTAIADGRRRGGGVTITYWLYRPALGWERVARRASAAAVAAAADVRVREAASPLLVPLETLPGRNHYEFPAAERPPWQWALAPIHERLP